MKSQDHMRGSLEDDTYDDQNFFSALHKENQKFIKRRKRLTDKLKVQGRIKIIIYEKYQKKSNYSCLN